MKDIYILQMHTGTIPSIIIKLFTRYKYSHVLLSLDNSFKKMYSFGRKQLFNPLNGGLVIEDIDGKFFKRFNKTKCRIYRLSITNEQYNKLANILNDFEQNLDDYKYDFLGIIFKCVSISITRENHYVCSQFVAEVLNKADIYNFNKPISLVTPKDFETIINTENIFDGLLVEAKKIG